MAVASRTLVRVEDLKVHFSLRPSLGERLLGAKERRLLAVDGVTFDIREGETLGLVGESGCGKSTLARAILQLHRPTAGKVYFEDVELTSLDAEGLRRMRSKIQIIFQDPYASLNPRRTVGEIVGLPLKVQGVPAGEIRDRVAHLLERVGLSPSHMSRYPHQFSGGQRQRIGIARALAARPKFIAADEPLSALDVSVQAQILNLLEDLQATYGLTYLFITHDLSVVSHISDRVAVMYLGQIVEIARTDELFERPLHPYTRALLSAIPGCGGRKGRILLDGVVPTPVDLPPGCRFAARCYSRAKDAACERETPKLRDVGSGHLVACHHV